MFTNQIEIAILAIIGLMYILLGSGIATLIKEKYELVRYSATAVLFILIFLLIAATRRYSPITIIPLDIMLFVISGFCITLGIRWHKFFST